jgi:hypothetical protein
MTTDKLYGMGIKISESVSGHNQRFGLFHVREDSFRQYGTEQGPYSIGRPFFKDGEHEVRYRFIDENGTVKFYAERRDQRDYWIPYCGPYDLPSGLQGSGVLLEIGLVQTYIDDYDPLTAPDEARLLSAGCYLEADLPDDHPQIDGTTSGAVDKFITFRSSSITSDLGVHRDFAVANNSGTVPARNPGWIVQSWGGDWADWFDCTDPQDQDELADRFTLFQNLRAPRDDFLSFLQAKNLQAGLRVIRNTTAANNCESAGSPEVVAMSPLEGARYNICNGDHIELDARAQLYDWWESIEDADSTIVQVLIDSEYRTSLGVTGVALTGNPTGGNYTLTFDGDTTQNISYNAGTTAIESRLETDVTSLDEVGLEAYGDADLSDGGWAYLAFINDLSNALTGDFSGLTGGTTPDGTIYTSQASRYLYDQDGLTQFYTAPVLCSSPWDGSSPGVIPSTGNIWKGIKAFNESASPNVRHQTARTVARSVWPTLDVFTDPAYYRRDNYVGLDVTCTWVRVHMAPRHPIAAAFSAEWHRQIARHDSSTPKKALVGAQLGRGAYGAVPVDMLTESCWMVACFGCHGTSHWGDDSICNSDYGDTGTITGISLGNPTTITCASAHGLIVGDVIKISGNVATVDSINGSHIVRSIPTTTTFTINVNVTDRGNNNGTWVVKKFRYGGQASWNALASLKADLYDPHSDLLLNWTPRSRRFAVYDGLESTWFYWLEAYYVDNITRAAFRTGEPFDHIGGWEILDNVLNNYDCLLCPASYVIPSDIRDKIKAFAEGGGTVICAPNSALNQAGEADSWDWPDGNSLDVLDGTYSDKYGSNLAPTYQDYKIAQGQGLYPHEYRDFLDNVAADLISKFPWTSRISMDRKDVICNWLQKDGNEYVVLINDRRAYGDFCDDFWGYQYALDKGQYSLVSVTLDDAAIVSLTDIVTDEVFTKSGGSFTIPLYPGSGRILCASTVLPDSLAVEAILNWPAILTDDDVTILRPVLSIDSLLVSPAVNTDAIISPAALAIEATLYQAAIGTDGGITILPAALEVSPALITSVVDTDAVISPATLTAAATLNQPTILTNDAVVTPSELAIAASLNAATISTDALVSVTTLSVLISAVDPTIQTDVVVSVSSHDVTASLVSPTISADSINLPNVLSAQATLNQPAILTDDGVTILPAVLVASTSLLSPSVSIGSTVSATAFGVTTVVCGPTVSTDAVISATALTITASVPSPSLLTDAIVSAAVLLATASLADSTVNTDAIISASALSDAVSVVDPVVNTDAIISAPTLSVTASVVGPTVNTDATIQPSALTTQATLNEPTVAIRYHVTILPECLQAIASAQTASASTGAAIIVATLEAGASLLPPSVTKLGWLMTCARYIEDSGLGTVADDIFVGGLLDIPANQIAVEASGGEKNKSHRFMGLQVWCRNESALSALDIAEDLRLLFYNKWNVLPDYPGRFHTNRQLGTPTLDQNKHTIYEIDCMFHTTQKDIAI